MDTTVDNVDIRYNNLLDLIKKGHRSQHNYSHSKKKRQHPNREWASSELEKLINERYRFFKKHREKPTNETIKEHFKYLRNAVTRQRRKEKKDYSHKRNLKIVAKTLKNLGGL